MRKKHNIILVLLVIVLLGPQAGKGSGKGDLGLVFVAAPTKSVYPRAEPIEFNFSLRNTSKENFIVARRFVLTQNIDLEVSNREGRTAGWCGRIISQIDTPDSFRILTPGETIRARLIVSCRDKGDRGRAWGYDLDTPGTYTVKATYGLPQPKKYLAHLFPNALVIPDHIVADATTFEVK